MIKLKQDERLDYGRVESDPRIVFRKVSKKEKPKRIRFMALYPSGV